MTKNKIELVDELSGVESLENKLYGPNGLYKAFATLLLGCATGKKDIILQRGLTGVEEPGDCVISAKYYEGQLGGVVISQGEKFSPTSFKKGYHKRYLWLPSSGPIGPGSGHCFVDQKGCHEPVRMVRYLHGLKTAGEVRQLALEQFNKTTAQAYYIIAREALSVLEYSSDE